jgi:oxygen-independent coproporphyrinogen-3 oxidase
VVTPHARPFVRAIAAHLDTYLERGTARHSVAV